MRWQILCALVIRNTATSTGYPHLPVYDSTCSGDWYDAVRLMRRIDELHLESPFAGSRMRRDLLHQEDFDVGRKHVANLMRKMGIEALYRRPNTSRKYPAYPVYPYLLRGLRRTQPDQVWAMGKLFTVRLATSVLLRCQTESESAQA